MNIFYGSAEKHSGSSRSAIEDMPGLARKITLMWPSRELDTFIQTAVMDGRDGDRRGFPTEVGAELLFLSELNKVVRAFELAARESIKPSAAYRKVDDGDRAALHPERTWEHPLMAARPSQISPASTSQSLRKPKPKRSLFSKIFSIR